VLFNCKSFDVMNVQFITNCKMIVSRSNLLFPTLIVSTTSVFVFVTADNFWFLKIL